MVKRKFLTKDDLISIKQILTVTRKHIGRERSTEVIKRLEEKIDEELK